MPLSPDLTTADIERVLDETYPDEWRKASIDQLREWLARELHDVANIVVEVAKAYSELTGGLLSKPLTRSDAVVAAATERFARLHAIELRDDLGLAPSDPTAWLPGTLIVHPDGTTATLVRRKSIDERGTTGWPGNWLADGSGLADRAVAGYGWRPVGELATIVAGLCSHVAERLGDRE